MSFPNSGSFNSYANVYQRVVEKYIHRNGDDWGDGLSLVVIPCFNLHAFT